MDEFGVVIFLASSDVFGREIRERERICPKLPRKYFFFFFWLQNEGSRGIYTKKMPF